MSVFSTYFGVKHQQLQEHGAFNISLISDLPLFVDPFLLYESENGKYQDLKDEVQKYFLMLYKTKTPKSLCAFNEVPNNWFGYCEYGNKGHGLSNKFAKDLKDNIHIMFEDDFIHIGKLSLIKKDLGADNISDLIVVIIKHYFLSYTESFVEKYMIDSDKVDVFPVKKAKFNFYTDEWESGEYKLPFILNEKNEKEYVILTPKDLLTKGDSWINESSMITDFEDVVSSIGNDELRFRLLALETKYLPLKDKDFTKEEKETARKIVIEEEKSFINYYIEFKIKHKRDAYSVSLEKINDIELRYIYKIKETVENLSNNTDFYTSNDIDHKIKILKEYISDKLITSIFKVNNGVEKNKDNLKKIISFIWLYKVDVTNKNKSFNLPFNVTFSLSLPGVIKKEANKPSGKKCLIICYSESDIRKVEILLSKCDNKDIFDIVTCFN